MRVNTQIIVLITILVLFDSCTSNTNTYKSIKKNHVEVFYKGSVSKYEAEKVAEFFIQESEDEKEFTIGFEKKTNSDIYEIRVIPSNKVKSIFTIFRTAEQDRKQSLYPNSMHSREEKENSLRLYREYGNKKKIVINSFRELLARLKEYAFQNKEIVLLLCDEDFNSYEVVNLKK